MPGLWQPKGASDADASAHLANGRYKLAVSKIQSAWHLSESERKQRLAMLHAEHRRKMDSLRAQRQQAFRDAEDDALRRLMRSEHAAKSTLTMDSYRRRVEELAERTTEELAAAYQLAELMDDPIGMQAVAVHALRRRVPGMPQDPATKLVARFASARDPNGDWTFPQASIGWDNLRALEQWTRQDHFAAEAAYSVSATPEKPKPRKPVDPVAEAERDVQSLYHYSGPSNTDPAQVTSNGQAQGEPTAAP